MFLRNKFYITVILLLINGYVFSQNILDQQITIPQNKYKIGELLTIIEQKSGARFSYNADLIDTKRNINYQAANKEVEYCLNDIFDNKLKYQVSGRYIILLKKTKQAKQKKNKIVISGKISDINNLPIENVSIYDIANRSSVLSNKNGNFSINIKNNDFEGFSVSKTGYIDTVLLLNKQNTRKPINITLVARDTIFFDNYIRQQEILQINDVIVLDYFIPYQTQINSQNLTHINDVQTFQISLLPGLSSNLSKYGVLRNRISFNVLIGYSRGVEIIEIGGLLNFDKKDVKWVQIGGLGNIVGENITGFQAGGITNIVLGDGKGFQIGGITNIHKGNFKGIQIGGILNSTGGDFIGGQFGGLININLGNFDGVQVGGLLNIAFENINGSQIGGLINFTKRNVNGFQISGIMNSSLDTVRGGQISGIANICNSSTFQASGLLNVAKENKGVQFSGLLNVAKENKGFQLAPFNVCDTSSGVSIGFISYVKKGLHKFVLSSDEIFYVNANYHLGTDKFYNILNFSYRPANELIWGVGYGFGHKFKLNNWAKLDLELMSKIINYNTIWNSNIFNYYKFSIIGDFTIKKKTTIYFGPSINLYIGDNSKNPETIDFISNSHILPIAEDAIYNYDIKSWLGFYFGISF